MNKINVITIESKFTSNCYIIDINDKEKVYLVDPCVSLNNITKYVDKLDGILISHSHIDHIYNILEIYNYFKCKIYLNNNGIDILFNDEHNCAKLFRMNLNLDTNMFNNDLVKLGDGSNIDNLIKCLYTPGHSIDSMCYIIDDIMFTGDTLFNNNVGRSDLYSGNSYKLDCSLKMLMNLKNDYIIYPGHEECGKLKMQILTNYYIRNIMD